MCCYDDFISRPSDAYIMDFQSTESTGVYEFVAVTTVFPGFMNSQKFLQSLQLGVHEHANSDISQGKNLTFLRE